MATGWLHVVPALGRVPLRHLRPDHIERLYADLLVDGNAVRPGGLDGRTVLEIHMVLRRALGDAVRRGMIISNPAAVAHAPKRRPLASTTLRAWNAQQLRAFLDLAAGHRHHAALWVSANTAMRRSELLGLRWGDVELDAARLSVNGRWSRSATNSTNHAARPVPPGAASISTTGLSRYSRNGA